MLVLALFVPLVLKKRAEHYGVGGESGSEYVERGHHAPVLLIPVALKDSGYLVDAHSHIDERKGHADENRIFSGCGLATRVDIILGWIEKRTLL